MCPGASAAALEAEAAQLKQAKVMCVNPSINAAMTFIEPFPVGLLITLISAVVLRNKPKTEAGAAAVAVGN